MQALMVIGRPGGATQWCVLAVLLVGIVLYCAMEPPNRRGRGGG